MIRPKKTFDCLAFKEAAQQRIDALIRDRPLAELPTALAELAELGPLGEWWTMLKQRDTRNTTG